MIRSLMFLLFCLSVHLACAERLNAAIADSLALKQIDLVKDKALFDIIHREVEKTDFTNRKVKYYSVYIKGDREGAHVTVISELFDNIYNDENYRGYYLMNNKLIVFIVEGKYSLPYAKPIKTKTFKTQSPFVGHYDPKESLYMVTHGAYAYYVHNVGWAWMIPDSLTISTKNHDAVVTIPRRTSK